ncbi:MAG: stage II sporulation protein M [Oscillospiraceae bacterium]|nr:stage II sporulation protein M [Oscillospiraceae bacterium]
MTVNVQRKRRYKIRRIYRIPPPPKQASAADRLYILASLACIVGIIIGAYCFNSDLSGAELLSAAFESRSYDAVPVFTASLTATAAYIIICFFSGLSAAGQAVGYLVCAVKGMSAGYLSAFALSHGDIPVAVNILTPQVLCIAAVILAARENIRMSAYIYGRSFGEPQSDGSGNLRLYLAKFAVIAAAAAAGAAVCGIIALITGQLIF